MRAFIKYVPRDVVKLMLTGDMPSENRMVHRVITILFMDIAGFSSFSEKLAPDDLVLVLTEYFQDMCECIVQTNGVLDKVPLMVFIIILYRN